MNVQKREPGCLAEHLRNMERIGPTITEQFANVLDIFLDHMRLKIGNLVRSLGAGKVEHKGTLDNRHLDGAQRIIRVNAFRHMMPRERVNSPGFQSLVHFEFAVKAVVPIEELDRSRPIGAQDETVLP